jgi:hypothetical protein
MLFNGQAKSDGIAIDANDAGVTSGEKMDLDLAGASIRAL